MLIFDNELLKFLTGDVKLDKLKLGKNDFVLFVGEVALCDLLLSSVILSKNPVFV